MPFPVTVSDEALATPPDLARHLASIARAEGPRAVVPHVTGLVAEGQLTDAEASALAAAFLTRAEVALLCAGAHLAVALADPRLGDLLLRALDGHDPALLLSAADAERSVEDVLLTAAAELVDVGDPAVREDLLARLRRAGLTGVELPILCGHGSVAELRRWLPAVFADGLQVEDIPQVAARLARDDEGADAVAEALEMLEPGARAAVQAAAGRGDAPPAEA